MNELPQNEESLLTKADIQEFIQIYREEFAEELTPGDAKTMAENLLRLYTLLMQPSPEEKPTEDPKDHFGF